MNYINTLIDTIYIIFPIFIIISMFLNLVKDEKFRANNLKVRGVGFKVLSIAGIFYMIQLTIQLVKPTASGLNEYEGFTALQRATGPYWLLYLINLFTLTILPQLSWIKKVRNSNFYIWTITILLLLFTNFERIFVLVTSAHRDYVPSSW